MDKSLNVKQRVLIPIDVYQRLKEIEGLYESLLDSGDVPDKKSIQADTQNPAVVKTGGREAPPFTQTSQAFESSRFLPSSSEIPKTVIVNNQVPTVSNGFSHVPPLPREIFVKFVRKPYRERAIELLQKLEAHPLIFGYDSFGVISIRGNIVEGSSLFEFLPITFVQLKKVPKNISAWVDLLKSLSLTSYIRNKSLLKLDKKEEHSIPAFAEEEPLRPVPPDKKWYHL